MHCTFSPHYPPLYPPVQKNIIHLSDCLFLSTILDGNDSDNDEPMDTSYMEPQLMLDEYDEPVEFKYDPNANDSQENQLSNMSQQARQQAFLIAAQQKHQQQLAEAAAAAAGGLQMANVVGAGGMTGQLLNSMVSIPKLAPLVKPVKPKINKRVKLKQNGVDIKVSILVVFEEIFL